MTKTKITCYANLYIYGENKYCNMNRSIYDLIFLDITITYNYIYNIFRENLKIFLFCFEMNWRYILFYDLFSFFEFVLNPIYRIEDKAIDDKSV